MSDAPKRRRLQLAMSRYAVGAERRGHGHPKRRSLRERGVAANRRSHRYEASVYPRSNYRFVTSSPRPVSFGAETKSVWADVAFCLRRYQRC